MNRALLLRPISILLKLSLFIVNSRSKNREKEIEFTKYMRILYPYLESPDINNVTKLNNNNHEQIHVTYVSTNLMNYNLFLVDCDNNWEFQLFLSLMKKVPIIKEHTNVTLVFNNGKEKMNFFSYIIGNSKPYYENKEKSYFIDGIKILMNKKIIKEFTLELTNEEKKGLRKLFFSKEELKILWFIYRNFSLLYEKEFVIFSIDGKVMDQEDAKKLFVRLLRIYVYNKLYDSLY